MTASAVTGAAHVSWRLRISSNAASGRRVARPATSFRRGTGGRNRSLGATLTDDVSRREQLEGEDDEEREEEGEPTAEDLDAEARDLLQWPELSAQVRAFTATTLGVRACTPTLPLGATPEESATLLAETTAAATLRDVHGGFPRDVFEGTKDVRPWIAGAARGRVLSGSSLADVATTAAACAKVHALIHAPNDEALEPLRRLAAPLVAVPEELEREIRRCVMIPGGNVLDDASEKLAAIRAERRETERTLRALLQQKAQHMQKKNFAERAQIVIRLGRECIPIKAGAQSEMDGVVLDSSSTGQTVFKEPAEAVPLNNRILELATEEDAEVERVLSALTAMVVGDDGGASILNATETMAALDLASARASHAMWLGARPAELVVVSSEAGVGSESAVHLPGMQHPLLLERHLPKLPRGGKVGEEETVRGFDEREEDGEEEEEEEGARFQSRADAREAVVPVDFVVPPSTSLVAITGPNTGGKTASLKALGLALLMARAGLHIPAGGDGSDSESEPSRVPWTRRVLADLGDAQSLNLDGGLSTFSAHLVRLQRILRASDEERDGNHGVVVLLDEPGGGTDPAEGAALAAAVLRASQTRSLLTVATSHYEEVKALAESGLAGAANAAVEFDAETLRPTYRLLWGEFGQSNAISIAAGLGLAPELVEAAEKRWRRQQRAAAAATGDTSFDDADDIQELADALERERETQERRAVEASLALDRAEDLHAEVVERGARLLDLRTRLAMEAAETRAREGMEEALALIDLVDAREELDEVVRGLMPPGWTLDERGDAVPAEEGEGMEDGPGWRSRRRWTPTVGETVVVRQLGGAEAEVVEIDGADVTVRLGGLVTRTPLAGVSPTSKF